MTSRSVLFLVFVVVFVGNVRTLPNEKQAQELLLLDSLAKKGSTGLGSQDSLMEMLGRSKFGPFVRVVSDWSKKQQLKCCP